MQYQIDLGNLSVGIETIVVAVVSLAIASRNNRDVRRSRVAEFRREWIEVLRSHLIEFNEAILMRRALVSDPPDSSAQGVKEFLHALSNVTRHRNAVELMLNVDERAHQVLLSEMDRLSKIKAEEKPSLEEFRRLARVVLKSEWDRVRDDLLTK